MLLYWRLHRRPARWLSRWLAAALLFMQLATAAYACPMAKLATVATEATAAAAVQSAMAMSAMPECAGKALGAMDPAQPLLCQAHCQQGAQTVQPAQALDAPANPVLLAVLDWLPAALLPGQFQRPALRAPALSSGVLPPGSPPLYLALLVLRN